jgi:hypothetical protein
MKGPRRVQLLLICLSCSERKSIYLRLGICVAERCGVSPCHGKWHIAGLHPPYES